MDNATIVEFTCDNCGGTAETACSGCDLEVCMNCYDRRGGFCQCYTRIETNEDDA